MLGVTNLTLQMICHINKVKKVRYEHEGKHCNRRGWWTVWPDTGSSDSQLAGHCRGGDHLGRLFDTKTRERGMGMTETGIVAIAVAAISLVGNLVGSFLSHRKSTAIIVYRIDELEKKVQKHNNLIERTFQLEKRCEVIEEKIKVANHRIEDLEKAEKAVVRR